MSGSQSHQKMNMIAHPTNGMSNSLHLTNDTSEISVQSRADLG